MFLSFSFSCALSYIETDSSSNATWSWNAYKKATAPVDGDFSVAANSFTNAAGFGNDASYSRQFYWVGTLANPSQVGTANSAAQSNPDWKWDANANKHDTAKKVYFSAIQYSAAETDTNTAATVLTNLQGGVSASYCGIWTDTTVTAGLTGLSDKGSCTLAIPTASTPASGALSLVAAAGIAVTALALTF